MHRRKHKLHVDEVTVSRYGFLYLGYKKHVWYWEAIIMLRKVAMVLIDVVLGPQGVAVQALVSLLLMVLMFFATLQYQPFEAPHIARLEYLSLVTSFLTLWMGSFFWASPHDPVFAEVLSALIVLMNVVFLGYLIFVGVTDTFRDYEIVDKAKTTSRRVIRRIKVARGSMTRRLQRVRGRSRAATSLETNWEDPSRSSAVPNICIHWPEDGGDVKVTDQKKKGKRAKENGKTTRRKATKKTKKSRQGGGGAGAASGLPGGTSSSSSFHGYVNPMELAIEMTSIGGEEVVEEGGGGEGAPQKGKASV
jgi:hypothetical protein